MREIRPSGLAGGEDAGSASFPTPISQMDLTMRVYTDGGMLGSADAVNALPLWTPPMDPQQQKNMATGTLDDCGTKSGTKDGTKTGTLRFPPVPPHAHVSESPHSDETRVGTVKSDDSLAFNQSGRQDLNLRPLGPEPSALGHKNPVKTHISEGLVPIAAPRKGTNTSRSDPRLVELAKAWPTLPEPLRAGIMAMVQSAVK